MTAGALSYAGNTLLKPDVGASDGGSKIYTTGAAQNPGYSGQMLTWDNAADTVLRSGEHAVISSGISTAVSGGSLSKNFGNALVGEGMDLATAAGDRGVGDLAHNLNVDPGTAAAMVLHATLGGLISVAKGQDFASGAIAGGAAEGLTPIANALLAQYASDQFAADDLSENGSQKKIPTAQNIGLLSASLAGGSAATGSAIGGAGQKYNNDVHHNEVEKTSEQIKKELGEPETDQEQVDLGVIGPEPIKQGPTGMVGALAGVGVKDTSTPLDGVATNIHPGQQGKHIPGNNNFIPGRSSINSDIHPQALLDGLHNGDYPVVGTGSRGQPIIDFGRPIGKPVRILFRQIPRL